MAVATPVAAQMIPLFQQSGQVLDPQGLEGTRKAPLTIIPSLTISEEFNDNIFLDNNNKKSDFITGFTPGIAIFYERPTYRLSAGYNFTAEIFAKESDESHAFDRQNFWLDTSWRVDPKLTLSLTEAFIFSTDTNLIGRESVSTGRDRSFSNTLGVGASYQVDPFWTVRGGGSWTLERFDGSEFKGSDVYRVNVGADRRVTPTVTVGAGYEFGYFDIDNVPKTTTHTPRVGVTWQATPTITLGLSGGPSIEVENNGGTRVTPAITASYAQRMPFGSIGLSYDRSIGTASGLGGPSDNDIVTGYLTVTTLARGLTIQLLPRFTNAQSPHSDEIDVRSFTMALVATYRVTEWMSIIGGYQFFTQRSDSTSVTSIGTPIANDADQNRVFVGVTFGYPIRFD